MVQHCANTITAAGIGNGSTLVICMGIITGEPPLLQSYRLHLANYLAQRATLLL